MKRQLHIWLLIFACSCRVPYQPAVTTAAYSYLVVDGAINSSNIATDSTTITLSRTFKISTSPVISPELHALVSVEDAANNSYPLQEAGKGKYVAGPFGLDNTKQYRLRIKTSDNKTYLSDFVGIKTTTPIDSVGYTADRVGVKIYTNTHDATNNTRYYRWDFIETYQYTAAFKSNYVTNGTQIVGRTPAQGIYTCWRSEPSPNILITTTKQLTQDVVYQFPIQQIDNSSEKIGIDYSIQLRQYALTPDAYIFWQQTKKNTEELGSIFDALPSQINGNIHSVSNPAEPVFGYLTITNIQIKRIFINARQLPFANYLANNSGCISDTALYNIQNITGYPTVELTLLPLTSGNIPLDALAFFNKIHIPQTGGIVGYSIAAKACADCTLRGTNIKPSYWK
jgi:hypothetical protein